MMIMPSVVVAVFRRARSRSMSSSINASITSHGKKSIGGGGYSLDRLEDIAGEFEIEFIAWGVGGRGYGDVY
jgi:hypothetical protein